MFCVWRRFSSFVFCVLSFVFGMSWYGSDKTSKSLPALQEQFVPRGIFIPPERAFNTRVRGHVCLLTMTIFFLVFFSLLLVGCYVACACLTYQHFGLKVYKREKKNCFLGFLFLPSVSVLIPSDFPRPFPRPPSARPPARQPSASSIPSFISKTTTCHFYPFAAVSFFFCSRIPVVLLRFFVGIFYTLYFVFSIFWRWKEWGMHVDRSDATLISISILGS